MNTEKTYENVMKVLNRESIERKVLPRMRSSKELINVKERNNVYFEFLDMVETFYVPLDANDEERLVITEAIIDKVGMTSKELLQAAIRNIDKCWKIKSLSELMGELIGAPVSSSEMDVPLFVATTNNRSHGASVFLSDSLMKAASGKFGGEVIILPSSVHEILLMPKSDDFKYESLLEIVHMVNRTEVSEEDFLSNNIYVYKDGNFQIIA